MSKAGEGRGTPDLEQPLGARPRAGGRCLCVAGMGRVAFGLKQTLVERKVQCIEVDE